MYVGARRTLLSARRAFRPSDLFTGGESGDIWEAFDLAGTLDATVQTLPGRLGRHDLAQSSAGSRPTLKARSDGIRYLDFASSKSMAVASSTALFKYLHDGTGGTVLAMVEWPKGQTTTFAVYTAGASTDVGFYLSSDSTQKLNDVIDRGSSGTFSLNTVPGGVIPVGTRKITMLGHRYKNDGGADDGITTVDSGRTRFTSASLALPSSASSTSNFGVRSNFNGRLYALLAISRKLTDAEVQKIWNYWIGRVQETMPTPDLTILVGGQSNASGRGVVDTNMVSVSDGGWMLGKDGRFKRLEEPTHELTNEVLATNPTEPQVPRLSFLPYVANDLAAQSKKTLWAPAAVGSTSISQWDTPATKTDRGTLFGAAVIRMKQAMACGGTPIIVWYGHESGTNLVTADYTNGGVGTAYQTAFTSLIANLRAELGNLPLVFVQLAPTDTLSTSVDQALVGEAQRQLELTISNAHLVVSHDVQRNASTDDVHIARQGHAVLGPRIALAIRQHVLGDAVNGTGPRLVSATKSGAVVTLTFDKAVNTTAGNYGNLFRVYAAGVEQTVSSAARNANTTKIDVTCSATLTGAVTITYGHKAGAAGAARTDFVADADGLPLPVFGPYAVT